jgi:hypothetical protein
LKRNIKTEMATEPKKKSPAAIKRDSPEDKQLANLKLIEKKLVHKAEKRIPNFIEPTPGARDASLERTERHLEEVRTAIKNHPSNKS